MKYDKEVLQKALQEIKQWFERSTSPGWMEVGGEGTYDLIGLDEFGDPVEIINQLIQEGFLRTRMLTEEEVRSNVGEGVEPFEVFELTNKKLGDSNMIKLKAKFKINDGAPAHKALDHENDFIKQWAKEDWEVGKPFSPDDFDYFRRLAKDDGHEVDEDDFAKYFEYYDEFKDAQFRDKIEDEHENSWMTKEYQDELDREHEDYKHENSWMTKEYQDELDREYEDSLKEGSTAVTRQEVIKAAKAKGLTFTAKALKDLDWNVVDYINGSGITAEQWIEEIISGNTEDVSDLFEKTGNYRRYFKDADTLRDGTDLTGKIAKYKSMPVKVLRKLTEEEKQKRAYMNNPDAGDYYEVEATSKALGTSKFIVWEAHLSDIREEDTNKKSIDADSVKEEFISEMRYKDYVIELFKDTQDEKYYWQAEYDGDDRKLSNFNVWIEARGISLYSDDENPYPTKAIAVYEARKWIDKQKGRWEDSFTELTNKKIGDSNMIKLKAKLKINDGKKVIDRDPFKRVGYYEVLWYEGETTYDAVQGDPLTKEFKDKSKALEFYNSIKDDSDKHMFWITSRTRDGEFIDNIIPEDEDEEIIIEQIPNMMKDDADYEFIDESEVEYTRIVANVDIVMAKDEADIVRDILYELDVEGVDQYQYGDEAEFIVVIGTYYNEVKSDEAKEEVRRILGNSKLVEYIPLDKWSIKIVEVDTEGDEHEIESVSLMYWFKDDKLHDEKKVQDNLEEIHYLRDRIYEYERKGRGSEEEYEAWKAKLEQLLDMEDNEEKHIYEFPELTDEDIEVLEDYDLTYLGHDGKNYIVEGYWNDLDDFTQLYLGYEMNPEHLYEPGEFDKRQLRK